MIQLSNGIANSGLLRIHQSPTTLSRHSTATSSLRRFVLTGFNGHRCGVRGTRYAQEDLQTSLPSPFQILHPPLPTERPLNMNKLRSMYTKSSSASQSFQVLSDLHLEVGQQYFSFSIPPSAPYLILAGDIGCLVDYDSYLSFLAQQTARFETVFLVLGNHEFYELSYLTGLATARKLALEPVLRGKLVLLHQTRYDVPTSTISILGCTLWSRIPESARPRVQTALNDFRKVEGWTIDSHNTAFEFELGWLKAQVADIQKENEAIAKHHTGGQEQRKILIVTHHAPTMEETAHPHHAGSDLSSAFATSLLTDEDRSWEQSDVKMWIFGHTHYTNTFKKSGIEVMSNQRGYVYPPGMPGIRLRIKKNEAEKEKGKDKVYDVSRIIRV